MKTEIVSDNQMIEKGKAVLRKYTADDGLRPEYHGMSAYEITSIILREAGAFDIRVALARLKHKADQITAGWNGEDDKFQVGGIVYTEDAFHTASEIIELCDKLNRKYGELLAGESVLND